MALSDKTELSEEQQERHGKVADMFSFLDKMIRGMKLYEGKGPLVDKLLQTAFQKTQVAVEAGEVVTKITPVGALYLGEPVSDGSAPKYLFQLFCDGVRELTFRQGVTKEELRGLATVFNAEIKSGMDDMVTQLWRKSLKGIRYYAVDTLGVQVDDSGDMTLVADQNQQLGGAKDGQEMTMSSSDMRLLKTQSKLNWVRKCKAPSSSSGEFSQLTDKITQAMTRDHDCRRFVAIALRVSGDAAANPLILSMLDSMISSGNRKGTIEIIEALVDISEEGLGDAMSLLNDALAPETLEKLVPMFMSSSSHFLKVFEKACALEEFDPESLVILLKNLEISDGRKKLQNLLGDAGVDMTSFYVESLQDEDQSNVLEAIEALGKIDSERAVEALASSLSNQLTEVRKAALLAMKGKYNTKAKVPLVKALKDPDKEVRMASLSILNSSNERMIGSSILGVMRTSDFFSREHDEINAFFNTLSAFPGPSTLEFLTLILSEKNLTRSKQVIEKQLMAISTLANMDSPDAKPALEKCGKSWFLPASVKSAAKEAANSK